MARGAGFSVQVGIRGGEQFREVSRALRKAGRGDLQKNLRRNIRAAARPVEADLRAAVMRVRVTSDKGGAVRPDLSTGLRARTARAIGTSVTQRGVRIKVNEKKIGPYGRSLPRYLDGTIAKYRRWRHPVFGQETVWVEQQGSAWFFSTIRSRAGTFQRAILAAMDETTRDLN